MVVLVAAGFGLFGLPRILARPLLPTEAEATIRELMSRQVRDHFLPELTATTPDSAAAVSQAMAGALREENLTRFTSVRVRRSWIGPPFARRWSHVVEIREEGRPALRYYRISRGLAMPASRAWWSAPVF